MTKLSFRDRFFTPKVGGLGNDVDGLVGDMEALRQGLEEADQAAPGVA